LAGRISTCGRDPARSCEHVTEVHAFFRHQNLDDERKSLLDHEKDLNKYRVVPFPGIQRCYSLFISEYHLFRTN
jgi:hypothetical protein